MSPEDKWNSEHPEISYDRALEIEGVTDYPRHDAALFNFSKLTSAEQAATIAQQIKELAEAKAETKRQYALGIQSARRLAHTDFRGRGMDEHKQALRIERMVKTRLQRLLAMQTKPNPCHNPRNRTLQETLALTGDYAKQMPNGGVMVFYSTKTGPEYFGLSDYTVTSSGSGPSYWMQPKSGQTPHLKTNPARPSEAVNRFTGQEPWGNRQIQDNPQGQLGLRQLIGSERVRGFQPPWRTVYKYKCPECGEITRVRAGSFRGGRPEPSLGAILCPHCKPDPIQAIEGGSPQFPPGYTSRREVRPTDLPPFAKENPAQFGDSTAFVLYDGLTQKPLRTYSTAWAAFNALNKSPHGWTIEEFFGDTSRGVISKSNRAAFERLRKMAHQENLPQENPANRWKRPYGGNGVLLSRSAAKNVAAQFGMQLPRVGYERVLFKDDKLTLYLANHCNVRFPFRFHDTTQNYQTSAAGLQAWRGTFGSIEEAHKYAVAQRQPKTNPMTDFRRSRSYLNWQPKPPFKRKSYLGGKTVFYKMRTKTGNIGVTGWPIALRNAPGFRFVTHRDPFAKSAWIVSEFYTGKGVGRGRNRSAAIAAANLTAAQMAKNAAHYQKFIKANSIN